MKRWTRVATLAILAALAVAIAKPSPANAIDTGEVILWSAVGAGAAIVIVLIATYFTRDEDSFFLVEPPQDTQLQAKSRLHFGPQCVNPDGTAALLCW